MRVCFHHPSRQIYDEGKRGRERERKKDQVHPKQAWMPMQKWDEKKEEEEEGEGVFSLPANKPMCHRDCILWEGKKNRASQQRQPKFSYSLKALNVVC